MSEEKKLTDEEIVKALDICTTADDDMDCIDGCPMYEEDYCTTKLLKMAFDLIQRLQGEKAEQKAEIERLTRERDLNIALIPENQKIAVENLFARFKNRTHQGVDLGGFFVEMTLLLEDLNWIWIKERYGVEVE